MVGTTVLHYKILEKLGGGGMGVVYKAQDLKLDRLVALKFLPSYLTCDPEAKERFVREAKAASALDHSNICVVHDICETEDERTFMVMTYYEGETLKKKIEREPLKINEAVNLAIQIAQGLQRAHEAGITHRDIKPANIMVTTRSEAKIVDFGLAKLSGQPLITQAGRTIGTAAYISPEQARGDPVDHRTDIWSLGVVLYEMLTGRRPFEEMHENSLMYSIINVEQTPPMVRRSGIPSRLEAVVQKCLAKDPDERYQHTDELLVDLRACAKVGSSDHRAALLPSRQSRKRKSLKWYILPFMVLLAAGGAGMLLLSWYENAHPGYHPKRIAVLPFENFGPAEDEDFADGLTNEINSRLGSISSLRVTSQTSSMQYKKTSKTLPVISRELGVDYILEGRIRWERGRPGGRIRFTVGLIGVSESEDMQLWGEQYDRELKDIFTVQKEIASHVVTSLGLVLAEGEKDALEAIPTTKLDAYQAYLRGQVLARRNEEANLRMAIEMLERATTLDSAFASAYAGLSTAHLVYHWRGYDRTDRRLDLARQALNCAFAIQPDLPETHLALGLQSYLRYQNYEEALKEFSRAQQKLPNDGRIRVAIASVWRAQGKFEEAIRELKNAFVLDPQDAYLAQEIGFTLSALGHYAEAERYFDQSILLQPDQADAYIEKSNMYLRWQGDLKKSRRALEQIPAGYSSWSAVANLNTYERNFASALECLTRESERTIVGQEWVTPASELRGSIYRYMGDTTRSRESFDSARAFVKAVIDERPYDWRLHSSLGIIYAGLGRKEEAIQEAELATNLLPLSKNALEGWFPMVRLSHVHIMVGNHDAAMDILESLLSRPAPKWTTQSILRLDPTYAPLRGNPRFERLLAEGK